MLRAIALFAVALGALPAAARPDGPAGHLVLIGGGERPDSVMARIAELAGGADARVLVVPLANPEPGEAGPDLKAELSAAGAGRVEILDPDPEAVDRWETLQRVDQASGVFFAGGDQARLAAALRGTELLGRIRALHERGGVVAGTSAGATVLGTLMILGPARADQDPDRAVGTIRAGTLAVEPGLDLLPGTIVDQHFLVRRRHNRLLTALLENPGLLALGLDEATAIVVGPSGRFDVLGEGLVAVYDASHATAVEADARGNLGASGVRLHLLTAGRSFDLEERSAD